MRDNCVCMMVLSVLALLSMSPRAVATCDPCTACSGDPVFIQKDSRNPELVLVARDLRRIGIDAGPIDSIAIVEGASGLGIRIVIFQEDGKRVEAEISGLQTLDTAVGTFLSLPLSQTVDSPKGSPKLVDPKAFLKGEQP